MGRELRSMTGFGRGTAEHAGLAVTAEVKCVNGRHLELRLRLPRELQGLEPALRAVASPHFQRGQVEVVLRGYSQAPVVTRGGAVGTWTYDPATGTVTLLESDSAGYPLWTIAP